MTTHIIDLPEMREHTHVFQDRTHAGQVLARMIAADDKEAGIILAIPAGGVPVGVVMAEKLGLDVDVAVVSKITLPWNTEAGYGAVAFDGTVRLNKDLVRRVNLTDDVVNKGIEKTTAKVARRVKKLRSGLHLSSRKTRHKLIQFVQISLLFFRSKKGGLKGVAGDLIKIIFRQQHLCPLIIDIQKGLEVRKIISPADIGNRFMGKTKGGKQEILLFSFSGFHDKKNPFSAYTNT
jgi:hypothetical protein